jgi:hypothetical protein
MEYEKLSVEELEKRVQERKNTLKKYIQFIADITRKRGVIIDERVGNNNIRIVRRLENFGGFTFFADTGKTMMGGEDYTIWSSDYGVILFSVSCQGGTILEVDVFRSGSWKDNLENVIKRYEEISEEIDQKDRERAEKTQAHQQEKEERRKLEEEARRLKL